MFAQFNLAWFALFLCSIQCHEFYECYSWPYWWIRLYYKFKSCSKFFSFLARFMLFAFLNFLHFYVGSMGIFRFVLSFIERNSFMEFIVKYAHITSIWSILMWIEIESQFSEAKVYSSSLYEYSIPKQMFANSSWMIFFHSARFSNFQIFKSVDLMNVWNLLRSSFIKMSPSQDLWYPMKNDYSLIGSGNHDYNNIYYR